MMKITMIAAIFFAFGTGAALAVPQNPQRMSMGFPFPVYVNNTGTNQTMTTGSVYVNQTQYNPAVPGTNKLLFRPTP